MNNGNIIKTADEILAQAIEHLGTDQFYEVDGQSDNVRLSFRTLGDNNIKPLSKDFLMDRLTKALVIYQKNIKLIYLCGDNGEFEMETHKADEDMTLQDISNSDKTVYFGFD